VVSIYKTWLTKSKFSLHLILSLAIFSNSLLPKQINIASAETVLKCEGNSSNAILKNTAIANYSDDETNNINEVISNSIENTSSSQVSSQTQEKLIKVIANGVKDESGNNVFNLNNLIDSLAKLFNEQEQQLNNSLAVLELFLSLPKETKTNLIVPIIKSQLDKTIREQIKDEDLLLVLTGTDRSTLMSLGLTETEAQIGSDAAKDKILNSLDLPLNLAIEEAKQAIVQTLGEADKQERIINYQKDLQAELEKFRDPKQKPSISSGSLLKFEFILRNEGQASVSLPLPNTEAIQTTGLTGNGTVTGVEYQLIPLDSTEQATAPVDASIETTNVSIPAQQDLKLTIKVVVGEIKDKDVQSIKIGLGVECSDSKSEQSATVVGAFNPTPITPIGSIAGCDAETTKQDSFTQVKFIATGIEDIDGNKIVSLGILADGLTEKLIEVGFTPEEASQASIKALGAFVGLDEEITSAELSPAIKLALIAKFPQKTDQINAIKDEELLAILTAGVESTYLAIGLTQIEAQTAAKAAQEAIATGINSNLLLTELVSTVSQKAAQSLEKPESQQLVTQTREKLDRDLESILNGEQSLIQAGDEIQFQFLLQNEGETTASVEIPKASTLQEKAFTGSGTVTEVKYAMLVNSQEVSSGDTTNSSEYVFIPPQESLKLTVKVKIGELPTETATSLKISLGTDCGNNLSQQSLTVLPLIETELVDPLGKITGCGGETLPDYQGFSIALYEPDSKDPTGGMTGLVTLTATELPDNPNNKIPKGVKPNIQNSNPFFLVNSDNGEYNFLFDPERGQLDTGRSFILVVKPPENSIYSQRRIKITIGDRSKRSVQYTATSLDGRPITASGNQTTVTGKIVLVRDAERVGLSLAVLDLATNVCEAQEISINKTGDRAAAAPGDTVLYRISVKNLAKADLKGIDVKDILPPGFKFVDKTVAGEIGGERVAIAAQRDGQTVHFTTDAVLGAGKSLNLVYGAQLTPDALRGSGDNSAIVNGLRVDNNFPVKDGPAIHHLKVETGILRDTGIIIGRVFVDKNFDGEQQPEEPGVPDAVIFLEDGNRIVTDDNGMFSVANMLSGYHTGILDLISIPGYTLAPNHHFSERNSKSRLVHLEPGGMVRMNFAVTPRDGEEKK
jgi:uncharacterized repeat protein (TIGR01451 family)